MSSMTSARSHSDGVTVLAQGDSVVARPIAGGSIAVVGDGRPVTLDSIRERLLAVCARPTDREELTELLAEVSGQAPIEIAAAIDELLDAGLLRLA